MNNFRTINISNSLHISGISDYQPKYVLNDLDNPIANNPSSSDQNINNQTQRINSNNLDEVDTSFHPEGFDGNVLPLLERIELIDEESEQETVVEEVNPLESRWLEGDSLLSLRSFYFSAFNEGVELSLIHEVFSQDMFGQDSSLNESKPTIKYDVSKLLDGNLEEEKDEEELCAICLDNYIKNDILVKLPCNHRYHKECARKWLSFHALCPICRRQL